VSGAEGLVAQPTVEVRSGAGSTRYPMSVAPARVPSARSTTTPTWTPLVPVAWV
jgi:hypothetical protein